ncbi:hypothetical protein [Paraburkholderia piptadeniae]|uniref:hypothetical protein n=1 Tax=Paraburkholderia piptadeniae TaxID=1701573 RepID=UPI000B403E31|nr:hypothetical protein [Paraburkholderia piptadeniae]
MPKPPAKAPWIAASVCRALQDGIPNNLAFTGTFTVDHADGFRQQERGQYEHFNGNIGYRFPDVETRFSSAH